MTSRKLIFQQYQNIKSIKTATCEEKCNTFLIKNQAIRQPDGKIHPSQIGECPRYIYFFMKKVPYSNHLPHSAKLQRTFDAGNDHETRMKKNMKNANILVDVNVSIPENKDRVAGVCDAIVNIDGEYIIVDTKIANSFSFKNSTPHKKYKYQVATYMMYIGILKGRIYYQNRDDSEQSEFDIEATDPILHETKNLIDLYNYNYDNNIIPDVTEIKPKCSATSCWYFSECSKYSEQAQKQ